MAAETLKARKSARAALRGNPAVGNGHAQPPAAVGPPSDDDDFWSGEIYEKMNNLMTYEYTN